VKDPDLWYEEENFNEIYYSGASAKIAAKFHTLLEKNRNTEYGRVIELGATHGYHFQFVSHPYQEYVLSDIRPSTALRKLAQSHPGVSVMELDVTNMVGVATKSYNRVVLTCLLHHIEQPEKVIRELIRITRKGGVIDILLPNDPSLIWNFGRLLFTIPKALKRGFTFRDYWSYVKKEHINKVKGLRRQIEEISKASELGLQIDRWPINSRLTPFIVYYRYSLIIPY
jgi:SAM-dependent methyltransferase